MPQLETSLQEIASFGPCIAGWERIYDARKGDCGFSFEFPLTKCFESNTFEDITWLLNKKGLAEEILSPVVDKVAELILGDKEASDEFKTEIERRMQALTRRKQLEVFISYVIDVNGMFHLYTSDSLFTQETTDARIAACLAILLTAVRDYESSLESFDFLKESLT